MAFRGFSSALQGGDTRCVPIIHGGCWRIQCSKSLMPRFEVVGYDFHAGKSFEHNVKDSA
ncbi:unnamed protein product [Coffea canephora]|uniref:Uncharacterized protein n=1 Tax=Coffea canephora TaxID=49390 RepID=A0A068TXY2_COFCA|nr:unnamed protein product [Coffea canephora]